MHKRLITRVCFTALCALPFSLAAQEGLKLRPEPTLRLMPPSNEDVVPVFIEADSIRGHNDRETEAEGRVRLRKRGQAFFGDWLRYDKPDEEITAVGNVRLEQGGDVLEGEKLRYNLVTDRGFMEKSRYTLMSVAPDGELPGTTRRAMCAGVDARGNADRLLFEGPEQYRAERAAYTTCEPGNDDWFLRARDLRIDKSRDVGVARDASIVFLGQTIFYTPYLTFSLHQERKSGFLTPSYGSSNRSGTEITIPYYWNIAPNRDATISPRLLARRGVQLNTEFRYLEPTYLGEARIEYLPGDRVADFDRYAFFLKHTHSLPYGWYSVLDLQKVSDDKYFTDLSTQIAFTSQVILPQQGTLWRGGTWGRSGIYSFSALAQRWQTLQADLLAPITPPYNRLPQLTLTASNYDFLRSDFDFLASYVAFDHPTLVNGRRLLAYPSLSVPLQTPYAYVTPKIGAHFTHYALDKSTTNLPDTTRTLPIFSTEAGLIFERDTSIGGQRYIQTLEPKAYYLYIPFRDQSRIPNFESGVQDINFASIFSENQFSGHDRINDANQVTLGIMSRFINAETGIERLRVGLAQRHYFQSQRVTLPGVPARPDQSSSSDLLAAISGTIVRHWTAEGGWQYNTDLNQTRKFNFAARYQPQPGKLLNLAYRETVGPTQQTSIRQTDISGQWPLSSQWTALGRWNYSLLDRRSLESLAGFEYSKGDCSCWVFRVVAHRFATATQEASTSIFLQLELNGVSRIGSNPLDTLRRNISGYVRQDPRAPGTIHPESPAY
ncbi:MAG: LPS-assembly protein LptD [Burkholderiales bacterium]|nr:LPS-assembly protein LptD [Burkholderiales bacterium]